MSANLGNIPVLAITATATDAIIDNVSCTRGVARFEKILMVPNR